MAWIWFGLLVVSLALAVFAFAIAVGWARIARRLETEAAASRLALVAALERAADEQTAKESALRLFDEQSRLVRDHARQQLAELVQIRADLGRVVECYKDAIEADAARRRAVH
jgi:cell division protein FtsB